MTGEAVGFSYSLYLELHELTERNSSLYSCMQDDTVQMFSNHQSVFKFAMEAFKFIGMYDQVCKLVEF